MCGSGRRGRARLTGSRRALSRFRIRTNRPAPITPQGAKLVITMRLLTNDRFGRGVPPLPSVLRILLSERALVRKHLAAHDVGVELHRAVAGCGDPNVMTTRRQAQRLRRW